DMRAMVGEDLTPALKGLLHDGADADDLRPGLLDDVYQRLKCLAAGEEVIDDEHPVVGVQELRRDHQQHVATLRRRGRGLDVDRLLHRDWLALAGIHDGQLHGYAGCEGRADAGDLGGEDARRAAVLESPGELAPHFGHEYGVHLVVEDAVDLEAAAAEVAAFCQDAPLQLFQRDLLLGYARDQCVAAYCSRPVRSGKWGIADSIS